MKKLRIKADHPLIKTVKELEGNFNDIIADDVEPTYMVNRASSDLKMLKQKLSRGLYAVVTPTVLTSIRVCIDEAKEALQDYTAIEAESNILKLETILEILEYQLDQEEENKLESNPDTPKSDDLRNSFTENINTLRGVICEKQGAELIDLITILGNCVYKLEYPSTNRFPNISEPLAVANIILDKLQNSYPIFSIVGFAMSAIQNIRRDIFKLSVQRNTDHFNPQDIANLDMMTASNSWQTWKPEKEEKWGMDHRFPMSSDFYRDRLSPFNRFHPFFNREPRSSSYFCDHPAESYQSQNSFPNESDQKEVDSEAARKKRISELQTQIYVLCSSINSVFSAYSLSTEKLKEKCKEFRKLTEELNELTKE